MSNKFQEIIATPAMVVPAMTTEEIKTTLLEASVEYAKKNLSLDTLVLLASRIQSFMGLRGGDITKITNILSNIIDLSDNKKDTKKTGMFVETLFA